MNDIRRIISLFVGLIVVLFLIAYAFGKMGFYNKNTTTSKSGGALAGLFGKKEVTPSPTPNASRKITIKQVVDGENTTVRTVTVAPTTAPARVITKTAYVTTQPVRSIPEAGAETAVLPLIATALFGGVYLRRKI